MYSLKALIIAALFAGSYAQRPVFVGEHNVECTLARVRILSALNKAGESVRKIRQTPVAIAASSGITLANDAIAQIAKAILAKQAPPADARLYTVEGLNEAATALAEGDMSDPAVVAAQSFIKMAQRAGDDVVAECIDDV